MTLRRRIALIVAGIIIFLALGPLIVLIAQGYRYDFLNGDLVVTGTLVVKTEPRGALVLLNGETEKHTPLVRRFLTPNEYLVEIVKPKYRPWRKRVNIFEHQVTFLPAHDSKINLLLERNEIIKTIEGVADTFPYEDQLFYINPAGREIFATAFDAADSQPIASTTNTLTNPWFMDARGSGPAAEFIISSDEGDFYVSGKARFALPPLRFVQFGENPGAILGLTDKNQVLEITAAGTKLLQNEVLSLRRNKEQIYYLSKKSTGVFWLERLEANHSNPYPVMPVIPFQTANIIISSDNQVYLLLDRELYAVKDKLEKINSQIEFAYWDAFGGFLLYGNSHEAWVYEPLADRPNRLLVRASIPTVTPLFHKTAGYIFAIESQEIKAFEANTADQPNVYSLLQAVNPKKISLNDEGRVMTLLDGQTLQLIQIR